MNYMKSDSYLFYLIQVEILFSRHQAIQILLLFWHTCMKYKKT